jgi:flagellar biosynthesis/type III secretory pathway M-ring protein FliF/YscJ
VHVGAAKLPAGTAAVHAVGRAGTETRNVEGAAAELPELPAAPPKKADLIAQRLRDAIKKEPAASAQVLRTWLAEDEQ